MKNFRCYKIKKNRQITDKNRILIKMKLEEIDIAALQSSVGDERKIFAKKIIDQFYYVGFLRCVNIPDFHEGNSYILSNEILYHLFIN